MKRTYRRIGIVVLMFICATSFSYANSSWHWITETLPFDILPWVVIPTLMIEFVVLCWCIRESYFRIGIFVIVANLLSFVAPFFIDWLLGDYQILGYDFERFLSNTPRYIIGFTYGVLTLAVEVPVLFNAFKKNDEDRKLLTTIVVVNVVTTALVFAVERIVCIGKW